MRKWIDLDAEYVLRVLNDYSGLTMDELYNVCGFQNTPLGRDMSLYNCLLTLAKAGFIAMDGISNKELKEDFHEIVNENWDAKFRVSDSWVMVQMIIMQRYLGTPKP